MAISYPSSLDALTNPVGSDNLSSPDHAQQHTDGNDIVEALEAKVGVGSGTPTANKVLFSNGNGTSVWSGTANLGTISTSNIIATSGTISGILLGTAQMTGGTVSSALVSGGTISGAVISSIAGAFDGWVTAGETWTYVSADSPTFTYKITGVDLTTKYYAGMRVKLTQATGGVKYFIITKVDFSTDTTITVYGGTDYTLNNEAISSPFYSVAKAPAGFPLDPDKWSVVVTDATKRTQAGAGGANWYNANAAHTISFPIGIWDFYYEAYIATDRTTAGTGERVYCTLSTANNSESDSTMTCIPTYYGSGVANSSDKIGGAVHKTSIMHMTSKVSHYFNVASDNAGNIYISGDDGVTSTRLILSATSSYL